MKLTSCTRLLSIEVEGQRVTGTVHWNRQRARLTATPETPYQGLSFIGEPRGSSREPKLFTATGEWTDFLIAYGTKLLTYAYKAARKRSDPCYYPDANAIRNTWPDLSHKIVNADWLSEFMVSPGLVELKTLPPNGRVYASDFGVAIVDRDRDSLDFIYNYEMGEINSLGMAKGFQHWRNFSSPYTQGIAGYLFFEVVLSRVETVITGPWRQSKIRFWWSRVHEARERGIHLYSYSQGHSSFGNPASFLEYRPDEEDAWDSEMDHEGVCLVYSKRQIVLDRYLTPKVLIT